MLCKALENNIIMRKAISIIVLVAFSTTFILSDAWAAVGESSPTNTNNVEVYSKFANLDSDTFSIPAHLGEVKYSSKGSSDKFIVHIQDAHSNKFAQQKVHDIIDYLNSEYGIKIINLEGGAGDYDLSIFTSIAGKEIRTEVADYFLEKGEINGAELYAINNPGKVMLWGVEDKDLYISNLKVYRNSLSYRDEVDEHLEKINRILNNLKINIYSPELLDIDKAYTVYKMGNMPFKEYIDFLITKAKEGKIEVSDYPNLYLLSQSVGMEDKIDFTKANMERNTLVDELKKILSRDEIEELVAKSVAFKTKRISQKAFYSYLINKAQEVGLVNGRFQALFSYVKYVSLYEAVDRSKVMKEIDSLEHAIKEPLFQNDSQRKLNALAKNLSLLKNFFSVLLTRTDYEYFIDNKDSFKIERFISFINLEAPKYRIETGFSEKIQDVNGYLEEMASFYEYSFKRDNAFIDNIKFGPKIGTTKRAILMTGGFHTQALCKLFEKESISCVSIVPRFTSEKGYESPYFKLLAGETADLQRMLRSAVVKTAMIAIASRFSELSPEVYSKEDEDAYRMAAYLLVARGRNFVINVKDVEPEGDDFVFYMKDGSQPERIKRSELFKAAGIDASETRGRAVFEAPTPVASKRGGMGKFAVAGLASTALIFKDLFISVADAGAAVTSTLQSVFNPALEAAWQSMLSSLGFWGVVALTTVLAVSVKFLTRDRVDTKTHHGYMDLNGKERGLPVVKKIRDAISKGRPIKIVGGGGSGKTENLVTALVLERKAYMIFDLRGWTVGKLSDAEFLANVIANERTPERIKAILSTFIGKDKKEIKGLYLTDETMEIKEAENYLLTLSSSEEEIRSKLEGTGADVVIFDEFDMGIKNDLQSIEIETANRLMTLARSLEGKQVVAIIHPPARQSADFMDVIDPVLGYDATEIDMEYLPEDVQYRVLRMVGISGEDADGLVADLRGLPAAFLDIMINEGDIRDKKLSREEITNKVKKELTKLKAIILDRADRDVQNYMIGMAFGVPLPDDLVGEGREDVIAKMKRTIFVDEYEKGKVRMSPVVAEVLREIAIAEMAEAKYIGMTVASETGEIIKKIEETQGVSGIKERLEKDRSEGLHLTLVKPGEMAKVREALKDEEAASKFLKAFYELLNMRQEPAARIGMISETGQNGRIDSTFFIVASDKLTEKVIEIREILGLKHARSNDDIGGYMSEGTYVLPHITVGFTDRDLHAKENTKIILEEKVNVELISPEMPKLVAAAIDTESIAAVMEIPVLPTVSPEEVLAKGVLSFVEVGVKKVLERFNVKISQRMIEDLIVPIVEEGVMLFGLAFGNPFVYAGIRMAFVALHAIQDRAPPMGEARTFYEKITVPSIISLVSALPLIIFGSTPIGIALTAGLGTFTHILANNLVTWTKSRLQKAVLGTAAPALLQPAVERNSSDVSSLAEVAKKYEVVFVHGFTPNEQSGLKAHLINNSFLNMKDNNLITVLGILSSFRPTIAASSIGQGDTAENMWSRLGVILRGGHIEYAKREDAGTLGRGVNVRISDDSDKDPIAVQIDNAITKRNKNGRFAYNEFSISQPEIAGFYVYLDDSGQFDTSLFSDPLFLQKIDDLTRYFNMPLYAIKAGRVYEATYSPTTKQFVPGKQLSPEEITKTTFQMPTAQRLALTEKLLNDSPFKVRFPEVNYIDSWHDGRKAYIELRVAGQPDAYPGQEAEYKSARDQQIIGIEEGMSVKMVSRLTSRLNSYEYFVANGTLYRKEFDRPIDKEFVDPLTMGPVRIDTINSYDRWGSGSIQVGKYSHNLGEPVTSIEAYLTGMEKALQKAIEAYNPETVETYDRPRVLMLLGFHLYGLGEQAAQMGDAATQQKAFAIAEQFVSRKQYEDVKQRRVGPNGEFRVSAEDIGMAIPQKLSVLPAGVANGTLSKGVLRFVEFGVKWVLERFNVKISQRMIEDLIVPIVEEGAMFLGLVFGNPLMYAGIRLAFVALHAIQDRAPPEGKARTIYEKIAVPSLISVVSVVPLIIFGSTPIGLALVAGLGTIAHILANNLVTWTTSRLQKAVLGSGEEEAKLRYRFLAYGETPALRMLTAKEIQDKVKKGSLSAAFFENDEGEIEVVFGDYKVEHTDLIRFLKKNGGEGRVIMKGMYDGGTSSFSPQGIDEEIARRMKEKFDKEITRNRTLSKDFIQLESFSLSIFFKDKITGKVFPFMIDSAQEHADIERELNRQFAEDLQALRSPSPQAPRNIVRRINTRLGGAIYDVREDGTVEIKDAYKDVLENLYKSLNISQGEKVKPFYDDETDDVARITIGRFHDEEVLYTQFENEDEFRLFFMGNRDIYRTLTGFPFVKGRKVVSRYLEDDEPVFFKEIPMLDDDIMIVGLDGSMPGYADAEGINTAEKAARAVKAEELRKKGFEGYQSSLGNKGTNLTVMKRLGMPVPDGVILTTNMYDRWLENGKSLPEDIKSEIKKAVEHLLSGGRKVSVRSSGAISMAGALKTELNVGSMEDVLRNVDLVFRSWYEPEAVDYRKDNPGIPESSGMAVVIQSMVYGDRGENSLSGVLFTVNAVTGRDEFYVEHLVNEPGESVVSGRKTPLTQLESSNSEVYGKLRKDAEKLARYFQYPQNIEFTVQNGEVYLLQTRNVVPSPVAKVKILERMLKDRNITERDAFKRGLDAVKALKISHVDKKDPSLVEIGIGKPASPGAVAGVVVLRTGGPDEIPSILAKIEQIQTDGKKAILVARKTIVNDSVLVKAADGVITLEGGVTSHAAVNARSNVKPAVVGTNNEPLNMFMKIEGNSLVVDHPIQGEQILVDGDRIGFDGTTGFIYKDLDDGSILSGELSNEEYESLSSFREISKLVERLSEEAVKPQARATKMRNRGGAHGAEFVYSPEGAESKLKFTLPKSGMVKFVMDHNKIVFIDPTKSHGTSGMDTEKTEEGMIYEVRDSKTNKIISQTIEFKGIWGGEKIVQTFMNKLQENDYVGPYLDGFVVVAKNPVLESRLLKAGLTTQAKRTFKYRPVLSGKKLEEEVSAENMGYVDATDLIELQISDDSLGLSEDDLRILGMSGWEEGPDADLIEMPEGFEGSDLSKGVLRFVESSVKWVLDRLNIKISQRTIEDLIVPFVEEGAMFLGLVFGNPFVYAGIRLAFVMLHAVQDRAPPAVEKRTLLEIFKEAVNKIKVPLSVSVIPAALPLILGATPFTMAFVAGFGILSHIFANSRVIAIGSRVETPFDNIKLQVEGKEPVNTREAISVPLVLPQVQEDGLRDEILQGDDFLGSEPFALFTEKFGQEWVREIAELRADLKAKGKIFDIIELHEVFIPDIITGPALRVLEREEVERYKREAVIAKVRGSLEGFEAMKSVSGLVRDGFVTFEQFKKIVELSGDLEKACKALLVMERTIRAKGVAVLIGFAEREKEKNMSEKIRYGAQDDFSWLAEYDETLSEYELSLAPMLAEIIGAPIASMRIFSLFKKTEKDALDFLKKFEDITKQYGIETLVAARIAIKEMEGAKTAESPDAWAADRMADIITMLGKRDAQALSEGEARTLVKIEKYRGVLKKYGIGNVMTIFSVERDLEKTIRYLELVERELGKDIVDDLSKLIKTREVSDGIVVKLPQMLNMTALAASSGLATSHYFLLGRIGRARPDVVVPFLLGRYREGASVDLEQTKGALNFILPNLSRVLRYINIAGEAENVLIQLMLMKGSDKINPNRVYLYLKRLSENAGTIAAIKNTERREQAINNVMRIADEEYLSSSKIIYKGEKPDDYAVYMLLLMNLSEEDFDDDVSAIARMLGVSSYGRSMEELLKELDSRIANPAGIAEQYVDSMLEMKVARVELLLPDELKLEVRTMLEIEAEADTETLKSKIRSLEGELVDLTPEVLDKYDVPQGLRKQLSDPKRAQRAMKNIGEFIYKNIELSKGEVGVVIQGALGMMDRGMLNRYFYGKVSPEEEITIITMLTEADRYLEEYLRNEGLPELLAKVRASDEWKVFIKIKELVKLKKDEDTRVTKRIELVFMGKNLLSLYHGLYSGTCFGDHPYDIAREDLLVVNILSNGELAGSILFNIQGNKLIMLGFDPSESLAGTLDEEKAHELIDGIMDRVYEFAATNGLELFITEQAGGLSNRTGYQDYILERYATDKVEELEPRTYHPKYQYPVTSARKARETLPALEKIFNDITDVIKRTPVHAMLIPAILVFSVLNMVNPAGAAEGPVAQIAIGAGQSMLGVLGFWGVAMMAGVVLVIGMAIHSNKEADSLVPVSDGSLKDIGIFGEGDAGAVMPEAILKKLRKLSESGDPAFALSQEDMAELMSVAAKRNPQAARAMVLPWKQASKLGLEISLEEVRSWVPEDWRKGEKWDVWTEAQQKRAVQMFRKKVFELADKVGVQLGKEDNATYNNDDYLLDNILFVLEDSSNLVASIMQVANGAPEIYIATAKEVKKNFTRELGYEGTQKALDINPKLKAMAEKYEKVQKVLAQLIGLMPKNPSPRKMFKISGLFKILGMQVPAVFLITPSWGGTQTMDGQDVYFVVDDFTKEGQVLYYMVQQEKDFVGDPLGYIPYPVPAPTPDDTTLEETQIEEFINLVDTEILLSDDNFNRVIAMSTKNRARIQEYLSGEGLSGEQRTELIRLQDRLKNLTQKARIGKAKTEASISLGEGDTETALRQFTRALDYLSGEEGDDASKTRIKVEEKIKEINELMRPVDSINAENIRNIAKFFNIQEDGLSNMRVIDGGDIQVVMIEGERPTILAFSKTEDGKYVLAAHARINLREGIAWEPQTTSFIKGQGFMQRAITLLLVEGAMREWRSSASRQPAANRMYERMQSDERLIVTKGFEISVRASDEQKIPNIRDSAGIVLRHMSRYIPLIVAIIAFLAAPATLNAAEKVQQFRGQAIAFEQATQGEPLKFSTDTKYVAELHKGLEHRLPELTEEELTNSLATSNSPKYQRLVKTAYQLLRENGLLVGTEADEQRVLFLDLPEGVAFYGAGTLVIGGDIVPEEMEDPELERAVAIDIAVVLIHELFHLYNRGKDPSYENRLKEESEAWGITARAAEILGYPRDTVKEFELISRSLGILYFNKDTSLSGFSGLEKKGPFNYGQIYNVDIERGTVEMNLYIMGTQDRQDVLIYVPEQGNGLMLIKVDSVEKEQSYLPSLNSLLAENIVTEQQAYAEAEAAARELDIAAVKARTQGLPSGVLASAMLILTFFFGFAADAGAAVMPNLNVVMQSMTEFVAQNMLVGLIVIGLVIYYRLHLRTDSTEENINSIFKRQYDLLSIYNKMEFDFGKQDHIRQHNLTQYIHVWQNSESQDIKIDENKTVVLGSQAFDRCIACALTWVKDGERYVWLAHYEPPSVDGMLGFGPRTPFADLKTLEHKKWKKGEYNYADFLKVKIKELNKSGVKKQDIKLIAHISMQGKEQAEEYGSVMKIKPNALSRGLGLLKKNIVVNIKTRNMLKDPFPEASPTSNVIVTNEGLMISYLKRNLEDTEIIDRRHMILWDTMETWMEPDSLKEQAANRFIETNSSIKSTDKDTIAAVVETPILPTVSPEAGLKTKSAGVAKLSVYLKDVWEEYFTPEVEKGGNANNTKFLALFDESRNPSKWAELVKEDWEDELIEEISNLSPDELAEKFLSFHPDDQKEKKDLRNLRSVSLREESAVDDANFADIYLNILNITDAAEFFKSINNTEALEGLKVEESIQQLWILREWVYRHWDSSAKERSYNLMMRSKSKGVAVPEEDFLPVEEQVFIKAAVEVEKISGDRPFELTWKSAMASLAGGVVFLGTAVKASVAGFWEAVPEASDVMLQVLSGVWVPGTLFVMSSIMAAFTAIYLWRSLPKAAPYFNKAIEMLGVDLQVPAQRLPAFQPVSPGAIAPPITEAPMPIGRFAPPVAVEEIEIVEEKPVEEIEGIKEYARDHVIVDLRTRPYMEVLEEIVAATGRDVVVSDSNFTQGKNPLREEDVVKMSVLTPRGEYMLKWVPVGGRKVFLIDHHFAGDEYKEKTATIILLEFLDYLSKNAPGEMEEILASPPLYVTTHKDADSALAQYLLNNYGRITEEIARNITNEKAIELMRELEFIRGLSYYSDNFQVPEGVSREDAKAISMTSEFFFSIFTIGNKSFSEVAPNVSSIIASARRAARENKTLVEVLAKNAQIKALSDTYSAFLIELEKDQLMLPIMEAIYKKDDKMLRDEVAKAEEVLKKPKGFRGSVGDAEEYFDMEGLKNAASSKANIELFSEEFTKTRGIRIERGVLFFQGKRNIDNKVLFEYVQKRREENDDLFKGILIIANTAQVEADGKREVWAMLRAAREDVDLNYFYEKLNEAESQKEEGYEPWGGRATAGAASPRYGGASHLTPNEVYDEISKAQISLEGERSGKLLSGLRIDTRRKTFIVSLGEKEFEEQMSGHEGIKQEAARVIRRKFAIENINVVYYKRGDVTSLEAAIEEATVHDKDFRDDENAELIAYVDEEIFTMSEKGDEAAIKVLGEINIKIDKGEKVVGIVREQFAKDEIANVTLHVILGLGLMEFSRLKEDDPARSSYLLGRIKDLLGLMVDNIDEIEDLTKEGALERLLRGALLLRMRKMDYNEILQIKAAQEEVLKSL